MKSINYYIRSTGLILLMITIVSFVCYQPVYGADNPLNELDRAETIIYGQPQQISLMERVEGLEKVLFSKKGEGSLQERIKRITQFVLGDRETPSLLFLINSLEWFLNNSISGGSILFRVEELEIIIYGKFQECSLVERIIKLTELVFPEGKPPVTVVEVLPSTMIELKLLDEINSARLNKGQRIGVEVAANVEVDDCLVVLAGTKGVIKVVEVKGAGQFGKSGEVKLELTSLAAIDGTLLPVELYQPEDDELRQKLAIGASLLGTVLFSNPIGLVVGYFVKGDEQIIPVGTEFTVKTTQIKSIYGLELN